jgi:intraflagellar transport protein 122
MNSSLTSQGRPSAVKLHNFYIFVVLVEVLPLVEFQLEPGISDEEAIRLIEAPAPFTEESNHSRGWLQSASDTFQTMQCDESPASIADPFTARLMSFEVGLSSPTV